MRVHVLIGVLILSLITTSSAPAQFREGDPDGLKLGETRVQRMESGFIVRASGGACRGIVGYTTVPIEWPEQQVKIVAEDISPEAKVSYQTVDGTAKMMVLRIPFLQAGAEAKAVVTFEITRRTILAPDDTDAYQLPDVKKLAPSLRPYLGVSPKIESRDRKIVALAKQIGADEKVAWDKVEEIYDWVRENVEYKNGPLKGAVAALRDGTGDCEELTSLFIAICRAADVPARTVWLEGHCYPEFYLVDAEGKGQWFPCQAAGSRAFGEIPELRPILSKGDSFRPPYNRRDRQRYLQHHLTGTPTGGRPQVRFVRKMITE